MQVVALYKKEKEKEGEVLTGATECFIVCDRNVYNCIVQIR